MGIESFVLCPTCGLPETRYSIKNGTIWHKCAACGAKEMVDMNHKVTNYILVEDKKEKKEKKSKKDKKESSGKDNDEDKAYLKEAMFGKKNNDDLNADISDDDGDESEKVVIDDEGVMLL